MDLDYDQFFVFWCFFCIWSVWECLHFLPNRKMRDWNLSLVSKVVTLLWRYMLCFWINPDYEEWWCWGFYIDEFLFWKKEWYDSPLSLWWKTGSFKSFESKLFLRRISCRDSRLSQKSRAINSNRFVVDDLLCLSVSVNLNLGWIIGPFFSSPVRVWPFFRVSIFWHANCYFFFTW